MSIILLDMYSLVIGGPNGMIQTKFDSLIFQSDLDLCLKKQFDKFPTVTIFVSPFLVSNGDEIKFKVSNMLRCNV